MADARAEVTDSEHGAEPILTTIIVGIAVSAGSKVAESLWKDVLWPRIRPPARRPGAGCREGPRESHGAGGLSACRRCSPYPGLEPWMWRSLLARAAVFHATRTRLSQLCDHIDKGGAVEFVLRDLEMRAREWAGRDVDDDTAVTRVVEAWDARLTETLGFEHLDATARQLIEDLRVSSAAYTATTPSAASSPRITAHASALYGDSWRTPTLGVAHIRRHPRGRLDAGSDPSTWSPR